MKIISKSFKLLTVFLLVVGLTGCSSDDDNNTGDGVESTTVVDVALANGFTSLAAALEATGLVSTLEGTGPFTVFAPTNDAFATLLSDTGLDLNNLSAAEEELVRNILLNHVIIGSNIEAQTLIDAGSGYASTASPGPDNTTLSLYYNINNGVVELNGGSDVAGGADVTTPNVTATNGIIHVVDKVIARPTIATFATTNSALSILVDALAYADSGSPTVPWISTVSNGDAGPFTVFAPTNDAFVNLLGELELTALTDLDQATVDAVLTYHVVNGANVTSSQLTSGTVGTIGGDITADTNNFTLTDANGRVSNIVLSLVDIQGINGVVHVIDRVILTPQG